MAQKPLKGWEEEVCTYCGQKGHWRPDCQELAEDNAEGCRTKIKERISESKLNVGLSCADIKGKEIFSKMSKVCKWMWAAN